MSDTENPTFHLDLSDLLPSPPSLRIVVYAINGKGKSDRLVLDDITLNDAEKHTGKFQNIPVKPILKSILQMAAPT